ncbi:HNH endonuclease signature motif containing protein [Herbiconiux solani]|uniref:HNH endonuclease signature motif containing protein n=1 Tax=Herbiconiux solani TaxID=661329 RepID=UPI000824BB1E|nr:HNH endonuclease signature motif containing protein [Herbiconiux solani]
MQTSTRLREIAHDLRGVVCGVGSELARLTDDELLDLMAALETVGRVVEAGQVRVAGEVEIRSRSELGDEGLSRSQNFTSPVTLVASVTGTSARESKKRLEIGRRLRGAVLLGGGEGPAPFPLVAQRLDEGVLAVATASIIVTQCGGLAERGCSPDVVASAEQTLVDETVRHRLTTDQASKLAIHLREVIDPDGAEPRDEVHRQQRSLTIAQAGDGMIRGRFALTPEQGGVWLASIQAMQSPRVHGSHSSGSGSGPRFVTEGEFAAQTVTADTRTQAQKNADTVTELIARAAGTPDMPRINGASTTVNVHITLDDLESGRGVGWIDGVDEPLPASAVAQLRCHSPIAATLFGDRGEVLYHGKAKRLFTGAQNRALAARDGGCVWPDCDRPPSFCETHHAEEWVSDDHPPGRTDIDNGVLLCHFHHSHLHRSSWRLTMRAGVPHLIPPRWVDTAQTPIPTTRRRTIQRPAVQRPAA